MLVSPTSKGNLGVCLVMITPERGSAHISSVGKDVNTLGRRLCRRCPVQLFVIVITNDGNCSDVHTCGNGRKQGGAFQKRAQYHQGVAFAE